MVLIEDVLKTQKHERTPNSIDGLLQRPPSPSNKEQEEAWIFMRNVALVMASFSLVASLSLESFQLGGLTYRPELGIYDNWGARWKAQQYWYNIGRVVCGIVLETLKAITLLAVVCFPFPPNCCFQPFVIMTWLHSFVIGVSVAVESLMNEEWQILRTPTPPTPSFPLFADLQFSKDCNRLTVLCQQSLTVDCF